MSLSNKSKTWIWTVTQTNWDMVVTKKIWAADSIEKSKTVVHGDLIIFYVSGTDHFRGIFKAVSDWRPPTVKWPDGRKAILEIQLEEVETGYASTKKLANSLEFISDPSMMGLVLKGNMHGPSNLGRSISDQDRDVILNELKKTKSPEAVGKQNASIDVPEHYDSKLSNSPIRLHLIKSLFENLLGPKNGPSEEVENLSNAYVVGILRTMFRKPDANTGADPSDHTFIDRHDDQSTTQDGEEDKISPDYDFNPLLGARSIGLSFVLSGEKPAIRACFTWGRYQRAASSEKLFRRQMNFLVAPIDLKKPRQRFRPEDHPSHDKRITEKGVEIEVISSKISETDDRYRVSVFLVNKTRYLGDHQNITDSVFQPQIRVKCGDGVALQELDAVQADDERDDEIRDSVIYAQRKNMGRGHFCGATWNEVDPEDYNQGGFSVFSWPDAKSKHFSDAFAEEFTRPDIRTEFFPTYSVLQPEIDDRIDRFSANELSETWDPDDLERRLHGIVENYDAWILSQEKNVPDDKKIRAAAKANLDDCRIAEKRISDGIQFLKSDEKARLAFCFMNKVIDLKSRWEKTGDFSWRKFQMAFILQCLKGVSQQDKSENDLCDILWFPTGGGKTEAYLGLAIFTIVFFRLKNSDTHSTDGGVSVISRYTLRLLTIQQFQRAVVAITAADYLRANGWLPSRARVLAGDLKERIQSGTVWGVRRISIGLLIGGSATPNKFHGEAERILSGDRNLNIRGEPSQVLNCPCCHSILAVPVSTKIELDGDIHTIHWIFSSHQDLQSLKSIRHGKFGGGEFKVREGGVRIKQIGSMSERGVSFYEIRISFEKRGSVNGEMLKRWWKHHVSSALENNTGRPPVEAFTSPERPGYFFVKENNVRQDFAIYCPNSDCTLNSRPFWYEDATNGPRPPVPKPFKIDGEPSKSLFMPIPAFTIDEQIFRRCPSMLISTVDKFAMLPFMEDFATVFGNVDQYEEVKGYGRDGITDYTERGSYEPVTHSIDRPFLPPSLVIQDELHLIEGPLGSMVGAYEIAFDILSSSGESSPKYIASSATIKEAHSQVGAVYRKKAFIFPPPGISIEDNYFSKNCEDRESKSDKAGRLYLGVCSPVKILTLPVRIWATLLSEVYRIRKNPKHYGIAAADVDKVTDPYWTLVGYYNAIKELQISRSLYEDDMKRDVRELSCQKINSVTYQKNPRKFKPGLRFFPVLTEEEMEVTTAVVYCNNSRGKVELAIFNSVNKEPGNIVARTKTSHRSKLCSKGANRFELEEPVSVKAGETLWVAVANDSDKTRFETGQGETKSRFADMPPAKLDDVFSKYKFPTNPVLHDENETVRISLTSKPRDLGPEPVELTGHTESQELPNILKRLNKESENDVDVVFTTAVFGTGIDIPRLGLMTVMGQPKTTSAYIQSTGRVGRNNPGLVVTWHRATNVRDLNHYENFVGYHRMLQRFVEPISASPFAEESMRLCLGPVLVSVLRNSGEVSKEWVDNKKGPMRIKQQDLGGSAGDELDTIRSKIVGRLLDPTIPDTRRPAEDLARGRIENTIRGWKKDAKNLSSDHKDLRYLEWTMNDPPKHDVVLGTPQHDIEKKTAVFKNVRTSMREVESTANFRHNQYVDGRQIRPSQFVTTYGPGSLLRIGQLQMIMPSLQQMIRDLEKNEQFGKPDENGRKGLDKFQIQDKKIEKTILGILEKSSDYSHTGAIKIFKLPSNADVSKADRDTMYTTNVFPKWAICRRHSILKKLEFSGKWTLPCSACEDENGRLDEGIGVRFIQACPKGHMGDVDWSKEVHKDSHCDGDEYDWDEVGNNFEVTCRKCDAKTTYGELRQKSESGRLECGRYWAEAGYRDSHPCSEAEGDEEFGTAKLVLKNASNLRITHVVSSLVIPPFADRLYRMLSDYGQTLADFDNRDFSKEEVVRKFSDRRQLLRGVDEGFLSFLGEKPEDEIRKAVRVVLKDMKSEAISEQDSEDSEFEQLMHASRHGYPKPFTGEPADFAVDVNKVKKFRSSRFGTDFVVTPVDILHVVKAQVGYRREVKTRSEHEMNQYMISTTGKLVPIFYEERRGTQSTKWFVGKKIKGEGIFIYARNHDVIRRQGDHFKRWKKTSNEQSDETLRRYTDPVFVWWHSLAHRLVADLSIDSGFQSTSIAEKTYLKKNHDTGKTEAGILLYAVQEGGDGTLGGLTGLVPNLARMIERSIARLDHCSNDPLCKWRKFNPNRVNGAACHACMLTSETSCGLQNRFLDRNLLLESM